MNDSDPQPSALSTQRPALTTRHSPLKLGLLGGSFNPIHNCHLTIAGLVRDALHLDQVLFIPTGDPPHKQQGSLAPAQHRYEMVRLAIADSPSFDISDIEVRRAGKSYSIDTIRELQRHYGSSVQLHFIIGLDAFLDVPTWKEAQTVLSICRFVVVPRPGRSFQSLTTLSMLPKLESHTLAQLDTGELPRLDIAIPSRPGICCLSLPPCSTSASDIRKRIRQGTTVANVLPPSVESYILKYRLYQEDCDHTHI